MCLHKPLALISELFISTLGNNCGLHFSVLFTCPKALPSSLPLCPVSDTRENREQFQWITMTYCKESSAKTMLCCFTVKLVTQWLLLLCCLQDKQNNTVVVYSRNLIIKWNDLFSCRSVVIWFAPHMLLPPLSWNFMNSHMADNIVFCLTEQSLCLWLVTGVLHPGFNLGCLKSPSVYYATACGTDLGKKNKPKM